MNVIQYLKKKWLYAVAIGIALVWGGLVWYGTEQQKVTCYAHGGTPIVQKVFGGQEVICLISNTTALRLKSI